MGCRESAPHRVIERAQLVLFQVQAALDTLWPSLWKKRICPMLHSACLTQTVNGHNDWRTVRNHLNRYPMKNSRRLRSASSNSTMRPSLSSSTILHGL